MSAHHILFYEYVENMTDRRGPYREAHLERIRAGRGAGRIVEPEELEAFAADDPYVTAGLVTVQRIERWTLI
jgi:uncharacterized protein YciI